MYVRQGGCENSTFAYGEDWLSITTGFNVSADLQLMAGYQSHEAASPHDSVFHGAIADTAPDAWGRRVIARDHAKRRKVDPALPALMELDYLLAVDASAGLARCACATPWHLAADDSGRAAQHTAVDRTGAGVFGQPRSGARR